MIFRFLLQIGVSGQKSLRCECLFTDDDYADKDETWGILSDRSEDFQGQDVMMERKEQKK